jgi:hypothetical protein
VLVGPLHLYGHDEDVKNTYSGNER